MTAPFTDPVFVEYTFIPVFLVNLGNGLNTNDGRKYTIDIVRPDSVRIHAINVSSV
eukprot:m.215385 g.215385  ORF g.215385 m.215385 type:complete len:56 (+) comp19095_c0_seq2:2638-2805(+)